MAVINQFVVKAAVTIRDDILRTLKNGLYARGVTEPNVAPGSDFYVIATALGNELSVVGANAVIKADAQMPDSATDSDGPEGDKDLTRLAAALGLKPQPATGSVGSVILESSATSPVVEGAELTDEQGQRYEVTLGGSYANGALIPIRALSTGESTNREAGDVLRWSQAPAFASDRAQVAPGGLVNGSDAEDSEALRQRVFARLQVPPGSANWEHVVEVAEASTNSVLKAFAYPAYLGPATCAVAVVAAPTETNKSRVVSNTLMTGTVIPYMNVLPRFGYLLTSTVTDVNADVAIALSLPEAPTANPPGPGGGWLDGTPWPSPNGTSQFQCSVTGVASTTVFTVDAQTAPTNGVSHIAWLSPYDWKLYKAIVVSHTGTVGAYEITIDRPFAGITAGCYIWPDCQDAQLYVDALLSQFALMGPGEKTTNTSVLNRGFRHPPPSASWPYSLGSHLLQALTNSSQDVLSAQFYYRGDGTQTVTGSGPAIAPQPAPSLAGAPRIYVPRHIGFYRLAS